MSSCGRYSMGKIEENDYTFTLVKVFRYDKVTVLQLEYDNSLSYGGLKTMVVNNIDVNKIVDKKKFEPHFIPDEISPMARFPGNDEGFKDACLFARNL